MSFETDIATRIRLLLHAEGAHASKTVVDSTLNKLQGYFTGDAAISTREARFGQSSFYFYTAKDGIHFPESVVTIPQGSFTFECFIRIELVLAASPVLPIFSQTHGTQYNHKQMLYVDTQDFKLKFTREILPNPVQLVGVTTLKKETWYHVAHSYEAETKTHRLFLNGKLEASASSDVGWVNTHNSLYLGHMFFGGVGAPYSHSLQGFMDEVRITYEVCRYTSSFEAPSKPFEYPTLKSTGLLPKHGAISLGEQGRRSNAVVASHGLVLALGKKSVYFSGNEVIKGTTAVEGVLASRQVRLYHKRSGLLVAEQFSSPKGEYAFTHLDPSAEYFVVAHDYKREFNAVISDMITIESSTPSSS